MTRKRRKKRKGIVCGKVCRVTLWGFLSLLACLFVFKERHNVGFRYTILLQMYVYLSLSHCHNSENIRLLEKYYLDNLVLCPSTKHSPYHILKVNFKKLSLHSYLLQKAVTFYVGKVHCTHVVCQYKHGEFTYSQQYSCLPTVPTLAGKHPQHPSLGTRKDKKQKWASLQNKWPQSKCTLWSKKEEIWNQTERAELS